MKLLLALLLFVFAHASFAQNQSSSDLLQLASKELPPCALECMNKIVGASACQLTDIGCIKGNVQLQDDLGACVKFSCTVRHALTAQGFLQKMIDAPVRDRRALGSTTTLVVGVVALIFYLLRVVARLPMFGGNWGLDDWAMTLTMILVIPFTICVYVLCQLGLGLDIWRVPLDTITEILHIYYFIELFYVASIATTKISVLLFYLRIFPRAELRKAIWITMVLCVLYIISFVTATALQCIPISIAWKKWDGEHRGQCINLNADAWSAAAINIVLDLVVIFLPLNELKKLVMSRRHKFGVMVMFLGGFFVTIVSMVRLKYLIQFASTDNITWDYLPIGYWSAVESQVGVMVGCLPAIRSLQASIQRKIFPKSTTSPSYYEDATRDSSKKAGRNDSQSRILSSPGQNQADKDDFVCVDEYEMKVGLDAKDGTNMASPHSFEGSSTHSVKSNEDVLPLASSGAPIAQPMGGILVQSEYTVNSTRPEKLTREASNNGNLVYALGGRILNR